ncbi:hypothetical protein DVH24_016056 [Malus domestica]|uniref:Uncharacterized protein n=1 Tax=Malus domestica TaxID=3750 RepID=A0A498JDQ5_MALDO|nr:hypothetical protein DVH24_016056 [Malus domestica]
MWMVLLPCTPEYRTVTRFSIVLLHTLISAENSTALIKDGSTILLKHFSSVLMSSKFMSWFNVGFEFYPSRVASEKLLTVRIAGL